MSEVNGSLTICVFKTEVVSVEEIVESIKITVEEIEKIRITVEQIGGNITKNQCGS